MPSPSKILDLFCLDDCSWTQLKCKGSIPSPRHGHLIVALAKKIYIHGGMAERELHSDLHVLDLGKMNFLVL